MNSTYTITDKLKRHAKVTTLRELSEVLKIDYDRLRNRCSRDSKPYLQILTYCHEHEIDIDELLFN